MNFKRNGKNGSIMSVRQFLLLLFVPFGMLLVVTTFFNITLSHNMSAVSGRVYSTLTNYESALSRTGAAREELNEYLLTLVLRDTDEAERNRRLEKLKASMTASKLEKGRIDKISSLLEDLPLLLCAKDAPSAEKAEAAVAEIYRLGADIGHSVKLASDFRSDLRCLAQESHSFENSLLVAIGINLVCLWLVYHLLNRQIISPLHQFRAFFSSLDRIRTGAGLMQRNSDECPLPASRLTEIGSLVTALGTLKEFLIKASMGSAKIENIAKYDSLTKLYNRRSFDEKLQEMWENAKRENTALSLIMMDVDKFKLFNDLRGHQAGDACLEVVGRAVSLSVREGRDFAARYGGEEFAVILPYTDAEHAAIVAGRIHEQVVATGLTHPRPPAGTRFVTVSQGIAQLTPEMEKPQDLIALADQALYFSKEHGRHCTAICVSPEKKMQTIPAPKAPDEV